jgi:DNA-binding GntR family transcriptional regulator
MINDLRDQIFRFRKILLKLNHMPEASNQDHRKMLIAIRGRDVDKVEELVREHISKGRETVLKAIEDRPGEL